MTKRTALIPALIAGVVLACVAAVLAVPAKEAEAAFPGENGKLVFSYLVSFDSDPSGIFAVNPDGTEGTELTRAPSGDQDSNPAVSPDEDRVVFQRYYHEISGNDLYSVGMDGVGLENLTDSPSVFEGAPAWSPDGSKIAFATEEALWTMGPDGSEKRRIADGSFEEPAWSPDGSEIAFTRGGDVYTMNADGSGIVRLTDDPADDASPDWSPDGSKIAFDSRRDVKRGIYVMNADGSEERKLPIDTTYPPSEYEELVFLGDFDPAWSPDGTKIAFARVTDHISEDYEIDENSIYTVNADGTGPLDRYGRARYDDFPSWGPLTPGASETAPPETTIVFGPSGVVGPDATLDFIASTPGSTFECSLDGSDFAPCEDPKQYAGLQDGEHTFQVRAKGPGGGVDPTPAARTWTVEAPEPTDGTAPTINALRPAPGSSTRDRTPTVRATVRDAASELAASNIKLRVDGVRKSFAYDSETDRLSRTTGKLSYGRHSVRVVAEDSAGNATTRGAWSFKVVRGR